MVRALARAACLAAGLSAPAEAIEIDRLTGFDPRAACLAYLLYDLALRYRAGTLARADFGAATSALLASVEGKGGRPNAGLERRIDEMMERITAEAPDAAELAAKAEQCRGMLGP